MLIPVIALPEKSQKEWSLSQYEILVVTVNNFWNFVEFRGKLPKIQRKLSRPVGAHPTELRISK